MGKRRHCQLSAVTRHLPKQWCAHGERQALPRLACFHAGPQGCWRSSSSSPGPALPGHLTHPWFPGCNLESRLFLLAHSFPAPNAPPRLKFSSQKLAFCVPQNVGAVQGRKGRLLPEAGAVPSFGGSPVQPLAQGNVFATAPTPPGFFI